MLSVICVFHSCAVLKHLMHRQCVQIYRYRKSNVVL